MPVSADRLVKSIVTQFNLVTARPDQVIRDCQKLRPLFRKPLPDSTITDLKPLFPLLQKRSGPIAEHLFTFLEETAEAGPDPLPFIEAMLSARDENLALHALENAARV